MLINNITAEIQNMMLYDIRHIKITSLLNSLNNISYPFLNINIHIASYYFCELKHLFTITSYSIKIYPLFLYKILMGINSLHCMLIE